MPCVIYLSTHKHAHMCTYIHRCIYTRIHIGIGICICIYIYITDSRGTGIAPLGWQLAKATIRLACVESSELVGCNNGCNNGCNARAVRRLGRGRGRGCAGTGGSGCGRGGVVAAKFAGTAGKPSQGCTLIEFGPWSGALQCLFLRVITPPDRGLWSAALISEIVHIVERL